jgi:putative nucleotidyltransferase with HDIG domain
MRFDPKLILGAVKDAAGGLELRSYAVHKGLLLVALCVLTACLVFPVLTFFGFSYKAGDVAVTDIRSPVEVTSGYITIKKGEIVAREGERITEEALEKFSLLESAAKQGRFWFPVIGLFVFTAVVISMSYLFATRNISKFSASPRDMLFMAVVYTGVLLALRFSGLAAHVMQTVFPLIPAAVYIYMIPVAAGAMLVRLFLNSETALVFAAVVAVMAGLFLGADFYIAAYFLTGGVVAAMGVRHAIQRSTVIKAGLYLGIVNAGFLVSIAFMRGGATAIEPFLAAFSGLLNGFITAVIVVGLAPLLEIVFGYTTNIKLLELSRMDHPLLKDLAMKAPGTYHHSIVIGTLVESAAEAIGANPLLARVSAYYHDIGKSKMPMYFIENMASGENRHDRLIPSMSALILTNHVKEGVDLATQYRLGYELIDVIKQHHGTTLINYFFNKAKTLEEPDVHEVQEKDFRYPGPKPQTREAGLVMLADAIEAASKTVPDPTPVKIQGMTQKIVNNIFADGQLDECELTLKDLHLITSSFNRVLSGIYHQRVDYPEPAYITTKEEAVEGPDTKPNGGEPSAGGDKKNGREGLKRLGVK